MRIVIESTEACTVIDGVPVRLWEGRTEDGIPCKVFVHRIAVAHEEDSAAFDRELSRRMPPGMGVSLASVLLGPPARPASGLMGEGVADGGVGRGDGGPAR